MSIKHSKTLKMSVLSATALAANSAWGGKTLDFDGGLALFEGGGLGVDYLALDESPERNVVICDTPANESAREESSFTGLFSDKLWIVTNSAVKRQSTVSFVISDIVPATEDQLLFLVYSTATTSTPHILTTDKGPGLGLDLSQSEVLATYLIPAFQKQPQEKTDIGYALENLSTKIRVRVNFDESLIDDLVRQHKGIIYIQAALISISDIEANLFENMILSEMDTFTFIADNCPEDSPSVYAADDTGSITATKSSSSSSSSGAWTKDFD